MAAVPTYIHFGDELITGGQVGVKPQTTIAFSTTGNLAGLATMMIEYQRVVPSGPDGVLGGNYLSYYDGTYVKSWQASGGGTNTIAIATAQWKVNHFQSPARTVAITSGTGAGQSRTVASNTTTQITTTTNWTTPPDATSVFNLGPGEIVQFHYIPNVQIPGANGDNWFENPSITPTGMLMQRLGQQYANTAPGFRFLKIAAPLGMPGWKSGGAAHTSLMAAFNNLKGITEGLGNTIDPKAVIVDCATRDIFAENINFLTDIGSVIDMIRADISATALIVFVMPHQLVARTAHAPWSPGIRSAIRTTVAARRGAGDLNIALYDMNWASFAWNAAESNAVQPADPRYYDLQSVIQSGIGLYNVIAAHYAPPVTVPLGKALAGVAIISDSQFVGFGHNPLMALYADQPSMVGTNPTGTVKSNVWIWDEAVQQLVFYDVMSNSNTWGTIGGMGPDPTIPRKLLKRYPQGIVLFKYGKNGLAFSPEAFALGAAGYIENGSPTLDEFRDRFVKVRVSTLQTLARSLDMIGAAVDLCENDAAAGEVPTAAFEARSGDWVDDVRDILTTRVDGVLPIVWMQPPPPASEVTGGSVLGLATLRNRVRAHLLVLEEQKENLKVIRNNGPDDWELSRDSIHYGGETLWKIGDKIAETLLEIIEAEEDAVEGGSVDGGTDDLGAGGGGEDLLGGGTDVTGTPGVGGLIVEDGTGIEDAESMCSVDQLRAFWAKNGNPTYVTAATDNQCAAALRRATREWVEGVCGGFWRGTIQFQDQRLSFPRVGCYDDEGRLVPPGTVPAQVIEATAIVAGDVLAGGTILPSGLERGPVTRETKKGVGFEQTIEYATTGSTVSSSVRQIRAAEALVYPLVQGSQPGVARS